MPRYFEPVSIDKLREKIEGVCDGLGDDYCLGRLTPTIKKDLSKVSFDTENLESDGKGYGSGEGLIGYNRLPNGMSYLGIVAGGDWEVPVFFIIYWDGKSLRGYIPEDGNTWNTDTKKAYGNDLKADVKNCKKRWPEQYKDVQEDSEDHYGSDLDPPHDSQKILADIQSRIVSKNFVKPKAKKENKSIYDRLEDLTFYGCGDEAVELFSATCHLAYKMSDDLEKAEILFKWAKEQAEDSKKDMLEHPEYIDPSDTCNGVCW